MPVVGLDHVQLAIPVGGEDTARAFYAGVLGLTEIPKPAALAGRGGCWFALAPGPAALQLHLGVEAGFRPAEKAHPGLVVDDLPGLLSRLTDAGVATVPDGLLPGFDRAYVADPFGNGWSCCSQCRPARPGLPGYPRDLHPLLGLRPRAGRRPSRRRPADRLR